MRLIDADALPKYDGYALSADAVARAVEDAPTVDAEPVVRCKDCKWRGKVGCVVTIVDGENPPKDDDFCSWGERREDETKGEKMRQINSDLKVFDIIINPEIMGTRKFLIIDGNNIRYTVEDSITMPWDKLKEILEMQVSNFVKLPRTVKIYTKDIPGKTKRPIRLIDGNAFLDEMEELCRFMGWKADDKHFSLNDLIINIERQPMIGTVNFANYSNRETR